MNAHVRPLPSEQALLELALERSLRAVAPAWPLSATVAVNPFLAQVDRTLAEAGAWLERSAGAPIVMERAWFLEKLERGEILDEDLLDALCATAPVEGVTGLEALKAAMRAPRRKPVPAPTIADLAAQVSGLDWPAIVADRIGAWAAGQFDQGQALWAAPRARTAFASWRAFAVHDLTPQIMGLRGFARLAGDAPDPSIEAIQQAVARLAVPPAALDGYFQRLLTTLGGWAQQARQRHWQAEREGGRDGTATDLLAIRLTWEAALAEQYGDRIAAAWRSALAEFGAPLKPDRDLLIDAILQDAAERAGQRRLGQLLQAPPAPRRAERPAIQAAFCIDVRSEVFRRAFETAHPGAQTIGFAGFFGLGATHRRFASDVAEPRLPVLLSPTLSSNCSPGGEREDSVARIKARAHRAWGRFKLAAVSCFAFVEAAGLLYAGKLLADSLGLKRVRLADRAVPMFDPELDLAARADLAQSALEAMGLTRGFARLVLLVGHGAGVVNNPFASALHCGACGGYPGDVNARLLAALLNDEGVRRELAGRGVEIPDDALFVGALHDTTSDEVTLFAEDQPSPSHVADLDAARRALAATGRLARAERAARLPGAAGEREVMRRGRDWAELRPEWGLAGCQAFIAAPRFRTEGKNLAGRAFLHDYDWRVDPDFHRLELILTAPVVVASWISLQYYGSTVAPEVFGAGDKLLHNVVGGVGVFEGNGGPLRAGLPLQSVFDGRRFVHEPLRLTVCIEAPCEAIVRVLERHRELRDLFDNGWLHLFALDEAGRMAWRYQAGLRWEAVPAARRGESTTVSPRG